MASFTCKRTSKARLFGFSTSIRTDEGAEKGHTTLIRNGLEWKFESEREAEAFLEGFETAYLLTEGSKSASALYGIHSIR